MKKVKSKFLKNLSPIMGIVILLVSVVVFSISVRSNMTGNAACNLGDTRESGNCRTNDCYAGNYVQTCSKWLIFHIWKRSGDCQETDVSLCREGLTCSGGQCVGSACVISGLTASSASQCCSGTISGDKCCNPAGTASSHRGLADECCTGAAHSGKCCIGIGKTGCSASAPCCDGDCVKEKCCVLDGGYSSNAAFCCSGIVDTRLSRCIGSAVPSCSHTCPSPLLTPCGTTFYNECGESCGTGTGCSSPEQTCSSRTCITPTPACTPNCAGKVCGTDGCGGSCGTCAGWTYCDSGQCVRI